MNISIYAEGEFREGAMTQGGLRCPHHRRTARAAAVVSSPRGSCLGSLALPQGLEIPDCSREERKGGKISRRRGRSGTAAAPWQTVARHFPRGSSCQGGNVDAPIVQRFTNSVLLKTNRQGIGRKAEPETTGNGIKHRRRSMKASTLGVTSVQESQPQ